MQVPFGRSPPQWGEGMLPPQVAQGMLSGRSPPALDLYLVLQLFSTAAKGQYNFEFVPPDC